MTIIQAGPAGRAELLHRVSGALEVLMDTVAHARQPGLLDVDVTMQQAKVLHLVWLEPGVGVTGLASHLGVGLSTVSGSVDRLVELGLLDRHEDAADRRHVGITLSNAGREVVERFRDLNARTFAAILQRLDDAELRGLLVGIPAMTRALTEHERAPADEEEAAP